MKFSVIEADMAFLPGAGFYPAPLGASRQGGEPPHLSADGRISAERSNAVPEKPRIE